MAIDQLIHAPAKPTAPGTVVWYDTGENPPREHAGVVGNLLFDEDVTLLVETASPGGELATMVTKELAADTPIEVAVAFRGGRTRISVTFAAAPALWHLNGRVTEKELPAMPSTALRWGTPVALAGPQGEQSPPSFAIIHGAFQLTGTSDNENVGAFPVILKTGLTGAANAEAGPWLSGVIVKNFRVFGGGDQIDGLNTLSVTFDNGADPAPVVVPVNSATNLREDLVSELDFATVPGNLTVAAKTTAESDFDLLRWSCEVHPV